MIRVKESERQAYATVGVLLCFAASLLAKPSAVTLPVVLATLPVVFGYEGFKKRGVIGLLAALFVMALGWGAYVLLTERTYGGILPAWPYRPFISAGAFWFYVRETLASYGIWLPSILDGMSRLISRGFPLSWLRSWGWSAQSSIIENGSTNGFCGACFSLSLTLFWFRALFHLVT